MMNKRHTRLQTVALAALACVFSLATAHATVPAKSKVEATYQKERAACLSGQSNEDKKTCLKEAAAARLEASRGALTTPTPQQLAQNALRRCQVQPAESRDACERMVRGEGRQEGSVAQGAVVREISTIEIAPAAGAASEASR
jgi:hypothetical protein